MGNAGCIKSWKSPGYEVVLQLPSQAFSPIATQRQSFRNIQKTITRPVQHTRSYTPFFINKANYHNKKSANHHSLSLPKSTQLIRDKCTNNPIPQTPSLSRTIHKSAAPKMDTSLAPVSQSQSQSQSASPPTALSHVMETVLYVRSMTESVSFYRDTLGLRPSIESARITGFPLGDTILLLFELGKTGKDVDIVSKDKDTDDEGWKAAGSKVGGRIPRHGPTEGLLRQLLPSSGSKAESNSDEKSLEGKGRGENIIEEARLRQHVCISLAPPTQPAGTYDEQINEWERYLKGKGVNILGTMKWELGGKSVYFEDVDGNVLELAGKGVWAHY